jgi:hypothetical protein
MRAPTHDNVKNGMVIIAAGDGSPTKLGPETDWNDRCWYLYSVYHLNPRKRLKIPQVLKKYVIPSYKSELFISLVEGRLQ